MTVLKSFGWQSWGLEIKGDVFIETGTGNGDSLFNALVCNEFSTYHSIDVSQDCILKAREGAKWRKSRDRSVRLHHGSSVDILPKIIDPTKKTVFWLDAHYEGPEHWSPKDGQCPLLEELRIIAGTPWQVKPVILIDDYAAFMSDQWWLTYASAKHESQHWPSFQKIFDALGGLEYKWNFLACNDGILYVW